MDKFIPGDSVRVVDGPYKNAFGIVVSQEKLDRTFVKMLSSNATFLFDSSNLIKMKKITFTEIYQKAGAGLYDTGNYDFYEDLAIAHDIVDHPKRIILQNIAYEYGHYFGYREIASYYHTLVDLIK